MEGGIYSKQVTSFNVVQTRLGNHTLDNPAGPSTSCIYAWKCLIIWLQILCPRMQHLLQYQCKHIIIYKCVFMLGWILEFQSYLCIKLSLKKYPCLLFLCSYTVISTELDKLPFTLFWIRTISGNLVYSRETWTENSLQRRTALYNKNLIQCICRKVTQLWA